MEPYTATQYIELFHLLCLTQLCRKVDLKRFALKGGCNLRFFFKSPRYSEDMDLDIEKEPVDILRDKVSGMLKSKPFHQILEAHGIRIEHVTEAKQTGTTQRWKLGLHVPGQKLPLPTKIEFSRRGIDAAPVLESVAPDLIRRYQLMPFMIRHYPAPIAFEQKIRALVSRTATQARDIFDLHLLLASGQVPAPVDVTRFADPREVESKIMSLDFAAFKGQVQAYLQPEDQVQYDSPEVWGRLILELLSALGRRSP